MAGSAEKECYKKKRLYWLTPQSVQNMPDLFKESAAREEESSEEEGGSDIIRE